MHSALCIEFSIGCISTSFPAITSAEYVSTTLTDSPRLFTLKPIFLCCHSFCYFSEYQGVFSKLASILILEIDFLYIRMSFFFYLSHAFLSLMILVFFHLFFSWSFSQREIHYARATAWVGAGRVACKLTACLLGITLYWQCDNARRAAALLLKGLHREHSMAALGGKRELGQKGVCVHDQQRFLFPFWNTVW